MTAGAASLHALEAAFAGWGAHVEDHPLDWMDWTDKGCQYHDACLTCPFECCLYEIGDGATVGPMVLKAVNTRRVRLIAAEYDLSTRQGRRTAREAAMAATGLSERTVMRAMANAAASQ